MVIFEVSYVYDKSTGEVNDLREESGRTSTCSTSGSRRMRRGILASGGTWRRQSRKTHVPDPW